MNRLLASVLASVVLLAGGGVVAAKGDKGKEEKGKIGKPTGHSASAVVVERVAAVVNDAIILESELHARMIPLLAEAEQIADAKERERRMAKIQSQALDDMVNEELIVQAAEAAKIEVDSSEVQAALDEIKTNNKLDDAALQKVLAAQDFTMANYKADLRRQLLRMRAVNQLVAPKVTVTDEDVRARYDQMQRRSDSVASVRLSHILVKLPPNPTEQQVAAAKDRAASAITRVKGGEDFAKVAAEMSDDAGTKATGGELGWFQRGSINAEWEPVVFSMEKGDVRGPVVGPGGLEVFQVTETKKSEMKPFAELKDQIMRELKRREMDKQTQNWLEDLRKKAYIDIKLSS